MCRNSCIRILFVASFGLIYLSRLIAAEDHVTIEIVGEGPTAKYIKKGETDQKPIDIKIGQTVLWRNNGNLNHTATAFSDTSEIIFDTGRITSGGGKRSITMTRSIFEDAGGTPGGKVKIEYVCDFHSQMKSTLVLFDGEITDRKLTKRRDITTLSNVELTAYRDAWRAIQNNGRFATLAGFHGCPDFFCHRDANTFLAWHREYLLRLEKELQTADATVALHYWDWTSADAISNGIPRAFTDGNYVSGGITLPNPLRQFSFTCPANTPPQTTSRNPASSSQLAFVAQGVTNSYSSGTHEVFDSAIEGPHGSFHVWVSGNMGSVFSAAYDPIFWAHHSNVDRQWASWQEAGGVDPTPAVAALPLRGFSGRTVGSVVDFRVQGFEYDRYDMITVPNPGNADLQTADDSAQGAMSRTFKLAMRGARVESGETSNDFDLVAIGIPLHPSQSFRIHVFANSPNPKLDDANSKNKNYLGMFGIFGRGGIPDSIESMKNMKKRDRVVLNLATKIKAGLQLVDDNLNITMIAEDLNGDLVEFSRVPIEAVQLGQRLEPATDRVNAKADIDGWKEFVGISRAESFSEAYKDAASQAQGAFGPDKLVEINVKDISGERGTNAGRKIMKITVLARVK